jgi:predicted Fe-S protein YdhL (DUF1289 family)
MAVVGRASSRLSDSYCNGCGRSPDEGANYTSGSRQSRLAMHLQKFFYNIEALFKNFELIL